MDHVSAVTLTGHMLRYHLEKSYLKVGMRNTLYKYLYRKFTGWKTNWWFTTT